MDDKRHFKYIQVSEQIIDYGVQPVPGQPLVDIASGLARFTKRFHPELCKTHSTNYQWFATVSFCCVQMFCVLDADRVIRKCGGLRNARKYFGIQETRQRPAQGRVMVVLVAISKCENTRSRLYHFLHGAIRRKGLLFKVAVQCSFEMVPIFLEYEERLTYLSDVKF